MGVTDDNAVTVCSTRSDTPTVTAAIRRQLGEYMLSKSPPVLVLSVSSRASAITACALVALVALVAACSSPSSTLAVSDGALALGTWGGDSAGLIVGDTATHLHIACTFGDVSGRIPVGSNGQFDVHGSYVLRAYPITVGPSLPAQFVGHLDGATATLTVIVDDTVQHQTVVRGPVVVRLGDTPRLGPCPICRRPIVSRRTNALSAAGHAILHWLSSAR